uniref:Uncharacterized protein n=1 Tax=Triticum urartu TaxID=4572 RepID=A0A8R7R5D4_TRIUA
MQTNSDALLMTQTSSSLSKNR